MSRDVVLSVQWLRGIAACAVVLRHAVTGAEKAGWLAPNGLDIGLWGVDLFFVISGFIMAITTAGQTPGINAALAFWRRRIVRVVPIYWLLTTLVVVMSLLAPATTGYRPSPDHVLASYLFIPMADDRGVMSPPLRVGWSLNFEMYFYLVFGWLLLLPRRWLAPMLIGWTTISVLLGQWLAPQAALPSMLTSTYLCEFTCGVGIGLLHQHGIALPRPAAIVLTLAGFFGAIAGDVLGIGHDLLPRILPAVGMLYGLLSIEKSAGAGWFNFQRRAALALGDWSYALYLTHILTLAALTAVFNKIGAARLVPGPWLFMFGVLTAIGVSAAVYRFVEQPLQRLTSHRTKRFNSRLRSSASPARP
jgi:peptidoglycan/LPS O-acetylase OafA/YrhL